MPFDKQKEQILARIDKSKKGSIDKPILNLVNLINSKKDYFTSSSCSGRIILTEVPDSGRKDETNWLLVKHSKVTEKEVFDAIKNIRSEKELWLRQESFILHICCRNLESAKKMLQTLNKSGLKRAGIITLGKKIMIEVFSTERLEIPIAEKGELIVQKDYLRLMIKKANSKHEKNLDRIKRLEKEVKKIS